MHRILFVDDEPSVLDGLRNLLRKERRRWDMAFAPGGREALDELGRARFDVVVSDMRMPGIDGAELLSRVKDGYPSISRIVLSGHADAEALAKVSPVANQYVAKPCDVDALRAVLERACRVHDLLEDERVRRAAAKLAAPDVVPSTYLQIARAVASNDHGPERLAAILAEDPAVSARFLELANTACLDLAQATFSLARVVAVLEAEMVKGLSLMANVLALLERAGAIDPGLLEKSVTSMILAARIARRIVGQAPEATEAFTTALVHDVGLIVLALDCGTPGEDVVRRACAEGRPLHLLEHEALGVSHAEVGAYLLAIWGLPLHVVDAVAHHHAPSTATARDQFGTPEILHVAGCLAAFSMEAESPGGPRCALEMAHLTALGVAERLPAWHVMAEEELRSCGRI